MVTLCARCGAEMNCEPLGACWCKELPHGPMPSADAQALQSRQAGQPSRSGGTPLPEPIGTGCLCRACLESDLREQGLPRQGT